jgi:hypothetical protein
MYLKINEPQIAFELSKKIWDLDERNLTQICIALKFAKLNKIEDAIACVNNLTENYYKFSALRDISNELANQGKKKMSQELLKNSYNYAFSASDFYKITALQEVSLELTKQGRLEEALDSVELIKDVVSKNRSFELISIELALQGMIEKATDIAIKGNNWEAIKIISIEYVKRNELYNANEIIKVIKNEKIKNDILCEISCELAKLDKIEMAIENANYITSEYSKFYAIESICRELIKKEKFIEAEDVINYITQKKKRYECWEVIGRKLFESKGFISSLNTIKKFSNLESKNEIKSTIINLINVTNINNDITLNILKDPNKKISSIEHVLQMYFLNQLFFLEQNDETIMRFNRILNIQWAIDIKNQLYN